jgi:arsenical pump membrane protein
VSLAAALLALVATLAAAIARPRLAPDWAVAAAAAALLVVTGVLSLDDARDAASDLGPTLGFLAALLVLAEGCHRAGLFERSARRWRAGRAATRGGSWPWCSSSPPARPRS